MNADLKISGYDLRSGLKKIRFPRKIKPSQKAILAFDGRFFSLEGLDCTVVTNAEGVWPGVAEVGAQVLFALAKFPPVEELVAVHCDGEKVRIGPLTVGCKWQSVSHTLLKLPAAPDWVEALSLKYRASRAQILADKLEFDIEMAERKLRTLIKRVAKSLAPLGVTQDDVRLLIEQRLTARYVGNKK